jgi:signal transduction histidine kinase
MNNFKRDKFANPKKPWAHELGGRRGKYYAISQSSFASIGIITLSIFVYEAILMILFSFSPSLSMWHKALLDPVLLVALLFPTLYFFLYRPLTQNIAERQQAEEKLRKANEDLDRRVHKRTAELAKTNEKLRQEIDSRKLAEMALKESEKKLRLLSSHLLTVQESQQRRISLELHDELGQALTILKLRLRSVEKRLGEDQAELKKECEGTLNHVDEIIENIRRLCRDLSPSVLEDLGLTAALLWRIEDFEKHFNVKASIEMAEIDDLFPIETQIIIYRIFQEALTNIGKHAQAAHVSVTAKKNGNNVSFLVEDDGKGFDVHQIESKFSREKGMGLTAMNERARMLGGDFEISSQEGKGTRITLSINYNERQPHGIL